MQICNLNFLRIYPPFSAPFWSILVSFYLNFLPISVKFPENLPAIFSFILVYFGLIWMFDQFWLNFLRIYPSFLAPFWSILVSFCLNFWPMLTNFFFYWISCKFTFHLRLHFGPFLFQHLSEPSRHFRPIQSNFHPISIHFNRLHPSATSRTFSMEETSKRNSHAPAAAAGLAQIDRLRVVGRRCGGGRCSRRWRGGGPRHWSHGHWLE